MKHLIRPTNLTQNGVAHYVLPVMVFILLFAVGGSYFMLMSHAATPVSLQAGTIKGIAGKCLDNFHNRKADANKVQLFHCNGTAAQKWIIEANGTITNVNGFCLDVAGGTNATAQSYVHLHACSGSAAQQWKVDTASSTITNQYTHLCLDDRGAATNDGNPIWLYQCNGTAAQKWITSVPQPKPTPVSGWLMTSDHVGMLLSQDPQSATWFFNTPDSFSMGGPVSGLSATAVKGYKSYAQFASDVANNQLPATTKWVLYDNESWTDTPLVEAQHPARYMQSFAQLAHQHGLKVIETPARDLMDVAGADCRVQNGEPAATAYIRCGIAADAQYADIYEIQAQGIQPSLTDYTSFVSQAVTQVKAKAPGITIKAGLTTDRGDSASQIYACWKATHTQVSGYWMNTTTPTFPVAMTVFDTIRNANEH